MTRKDSEKDAERPHYYSQFWLDVAAGRRVIGAPKPEEETEQAEAEMPEPTPLRKAGRTSVAPAMDGYKETLAPSVEEPEYAPEEYVEPEPDEAELVDNVDDLDLPNIVVEDTLDENPISDQNYIPDEEEELLEEEEDYLDEEEEEEEEEEEAWPIGRGRKKPKPGRQVKPPKLKKPKRDTRRGF